MFPNIGLSLSYVFLSRIFIIAVASRLPSLGPFIITDNKNRLKGRLFSDEIQGRTTTFWPHPDNRPIFCLSRWRPDPQRDQISKVVPALP